MNRNVAALAIVPLVLALQQPSQPADPTAYDASLRRALAPAGGSAPIPGLAAAPFPAVMIRGLVVPAGGEGIAILEVDSTRFRVRAGSAVPLAGGDALRVESIGADEVVLSRPATGETRSLR